MKVIIIEDEVLAQAKLEHLLAKLDSTIIVEAKLASVKDTLAWLTTHELPDLAFVDIQLSDDHSFEIFRRFDPGFPVIFTTAYDKYILDSFEYNAIDYLLKPITEDKLGRSLEKVRKLKTHFSREKLSLLADPAAVQLFPARIVARKGNQYVVVPADQVAYFFTMHKIVFVRDVTGRQMIVDKNLATLESMLDTRQFTRLNRKYIAAASAIRHYAAEQGKLRVQLEPDAGEPVYVSKESAAAFRAWIGQRQG